MQKNDGSSEPSFKFKQPFIKHWTKNKSLCPNVLWQSLTFWWQFSVQTIGGIRNRIRNLFYGNLWGPISAYIAISLLHNLVILIVLIINKIICLNIFCFAEFGSPALAELNTFFKQFVEKYR